MNEQTTPRLTVALDAAERYFATRLRADLWREASEARVSAGVVSNFRRFLVLRRGVCARRIDRRSRLERASRRRRLRGGALAFARRSDGVPGSADVGTRGSRSGGRVGEIRPKFRRANGLRGVENARRRTRRLPRFERTRNGESDAVRLLKARNS